MATLNYCGKQHLLCFCDKMNNCMKKLIPGCTSYYARHSVASIAADGQWFSAPLYSDGRTPNIFLNWVEKLRGGGEADTDGNLVDGEVRIDGEQLGSTLQSNIAYEVGGRNAKHVAQFDIEACTTQGYVYGQLLHAVVLVGDMRFDCFQEFCDLQKITW